MKGRQLDRLPWQRPLLLLDHLPMRLWLWLMLLLLLALLLLRALPRLLLRRWGWLALGWTGPVGGRRASARALPLAPPAAATQRPTPQLALGLVCARAKEWGRWVWEGQDHTGEGAHAARCIRNFLEKTQFHAAAGTGAFPLPPEDLQVLKCTIMHMFACILARACTHARTRAPAPSLHLFRPGLLQTHQSPLPPLDP